MSPIMAKVYIVSKADLIQCDITIVRNQCGRI